VCVGILVNRIALNQRTSNMTDEHARNVIIIGDGYSDYQVLKQFVSVLVERHHANEIRLNFLDYDLFASLNIGVYLKNFIQKANNKADNYDLFCENTRNLKTHVTEVLIKAMRIVQHEKILLSSRDLLVISSESEKPLGHQHNYFQKWAYSPEAILRLAIDDFYRQMVEQGYEYQYLPLVLPLIFFPSIEILVAACTEEAHDFDSQCCSLQAKPDLKQKVWATDSIDEARRSGMLQGVLETYMTPDALDKVYKNVPEAQRFIQVLRALK
jgi:hypothetical protein